MGQARLTNSDYYKDWPPALRKAKDRALIGNHPDWRPVLVRMGGRSSDKTLSDLLTSQPVTQIVDNYDEQLAELFVSENAQLYKANAEVKASSIRDFLKQHYGNQPAWKLGTWVYYPWSGQVVHVLDEDRFWQLRTIRNQYLVTPEEQTAWRQAKVGCAGMSVGSNGAAAIVLTSGSQKLKLSDGAVLSGSNLNRLRTGIASVGLNKCVVMARQLYEMNPYLEIEIQDQNLTAANLGEFFDQGWPLDIVVDEIDDLEIKVRLRMEAKKRRLPVVMVTEPGDDIMLDVERFDLDPNLPVFHGLAGDIEEVLKKGSLNQREYVKYAMMIIGVENLPLRAQQAMVKVGSTMPSPPQLGSTAMMAGGVIAFACRQLASGGRLKSGRHVISLEGELLQGDRSQKREFRRHTKSLKQAMRSM